MTKRHRREFADSRDAEIARQRLIEIRNDPDGLVRGDELRRRLDALTGKTDTQL